MKSTDVEILPQEMETIYLIMQLKQHELTDKEVKEINNQFKNSKNMQESLRNYHNAIIKRLNTEDKFTCNFKVCNQLIETVNKKSHLNEHFNREIEVSNYFQSIIENQNQYNDKEVKAELKEVIKLIRECEKVKHTNNRKVSNCQNRILYVIKLVDEYQKKSKENKSPSFSQPTTQIEKQLAINNTQREFKNVTSLIKSFQQFTSGDIDLMSRSKKIERSTKNFYNSLIYIGISALDKEENESRPFYRLLFIFLLTKLRLPINDLNSGLRLLFNHLIKGGSVSMQIFPFFCSEVQMNLLEKILITTGFPNLSNIKFGNTDWLMVNGIVNSIFRIRSYLVEQMINKEEIVFSFKDLEIMFGSFIPLARNVKEIGNQDDKRDSTLCGFLSHVSRLSGKLRVLDNFDIISLASDSEDDESDDEFQVCKNQFR